MRIKDNSSKPLEECAEISGILNKIANKSLFQLEQEGIFVFPNCLAEADDLSSDQYIVRRENNSYVTGNVMGFLGLGDERLIISSRFDHGDNDYLFQYLLEKVIEYPNITNLKTDADNDERIFNMLLFLFPQFLRNAVRKGLFKTYTRNKYNDQNVKGTIDVARHIRKNTPFVGNIAYSQREYSYDNHLTELVRHAIEYIKRTPYGYKFLKIVDDEVKLIVDSTSKYKPADRRRVIEENKKNVVRHAYYYEYRELQQLCILILQNEQHRLGTGSNKVFGILFDGAWLWEEYVNTLVSDFFYHPMNKSKTGKQYLFAKTSGNRVGEIYPDFIGKDSKNRIIADAKYKPLFNIGNKDYLQVLAYMFRFDAKLAYYFYPEADETSDYELSLYSGISYENNLSPRDDIKLIKYGLKIPSNVETFSEFKNVMGEAEKEFVLGINAVNKKT